jgi:hypothetical protein
MAAAVTPTENILKFDNLVRTIRDTFSTFPDQRTGKNTKYRLVSFYFNLQKTVERRMLSKVLLSA